MHPPWSLCCLNYFPYDTWGWAEKQFWSGQSMFFLGTEYSYRLNKITANIVTYIIERARESGKHDERYVLVQNENTQNAYFRI